MTDSENDSSNLVYPWVDEQRLTELLDLGFDEVSLAIFSLLF
jgi:hypothetical protein